MLKNKQTSYEIGADLDLTNMHELRNLLYAHHMRPNKSFGQNFLVDRDVLRHILAAAEIESHDEVLELGAGMGVLTQELAKHAGRVVAVELERDMMALLVKMTASYSNVELIAANLLDLNPVEIFGQKPYKLVANLPYYITAPTFRRFLEQVRSPSLLVVMVQYEVAKRIVALPGDLSLLGVSIQFYGHPRIVARVPMSAFYPAPKVDSAIVRIDVRPDVPLPPNESTGFFRVVQAGFGERRKQLHNALTHRLHYKNEYVRAALAAAHVDPSRRAETLSIEEWLCLWRALTEQ